MTAAVSEAYLSRDGSDGESFERELIYYTFNESDEAAAVTAAIAVAPSTYDGLPRKSIARKQVAETVYEMRFQYRLDTNQVQPSNPAASEFNTTLAFNLVGGTTHITTALATTSYATGATVDIKKTIGLDLKTGQVRGVDVFAPVMDYSYSTQFANAVVTTSYIDDVFELTGKTNVAEFYGRPIGSVLFKGARGTKRGADRWEVSFEFAYSPNKTGMTIGDIAGIDKLGWQYLDVMFREDSTTLIGGKPIQVPAQVNVHTVYESGDFGLLLIGDGT